MRALCVAKQEVGEGVQLITMSRFRSWRRGDRAEGVSLVVWNVVPGWGGVVGVWGWAMWRS